jgi:hypothetical protein
LDKKVEFFFYLGAVLCFVLAAAGEGWRYGSRGRRGLAPRVVLVPLGLALWLFPLMYYTAQQAF